MPPRHPHKLRGLRRQHGGGEERGRGLAVMGATRTQEERFFASDRSILKTKPGG
jgi:hypothetical protein